MGQLQPRQQNLVNRPPVPPSGDGIARMQVLAGWANQQLSQSAAAWYVGRTLGHGTPTILSVSSSKSCSLAHDVACGQLDSVFRCVSCPVGRQQLRSSLTRLLAGSNVMAGIVMPGGYSRCRAEGETSVCFRWSRCVGRRLSMGGSTYVDKGGNDVNAALLACHLPYEV